MNKEMSNEELKEYTSFLDILFPLKKYDKGKPFPLLIFLGMVFNTLFGIMNGAMWIVVLNDCMMGFIPTTYGYFAINGLFSVLVVVDYLMLFHARYEHLKKINATDSVSRKEIAMLKLYLTRIDPSLSFIRETTTDKNIHSKDKFPISTE